MQVKQTKTLESIFELGQHEALRHLSSKVTSDYLLLAILKQERSHAFYILKKLVKEWELYQIKIRIERELERLAESKNSSDTDCRGGHTESSASIYDEVEMGIIFRMWVEVDGTSSNVLHSGHLLLSIIKDRRSVSSQTLELYGLSWDILHPFIDELPDNEDYYDDIAALESISLSNCSHTRHDLLHDTQSSEMQSHGNYMQTLEKFGTNLTQSAMMGEIDPVVGRDSEIERLIQILGRRKKNNPALIGEAGVGKTAIVEGLALRIANKDVPRSLYNKQIFSLDMASLVAGTKYRGEFEERIQQLIKELSRTKNIILFIDEIHTIMGAGSTQGTLDSANILKPALARGELQCIGATTLNEYRQSIESDGALERRFQKIIISQPSSEQTLQILKSIKSGYESHHGVTYSDDALKACVDLTARYITDRFFPDKAIDIMDEAGSRVNLQGNDTQITSEDIKSVVASITGIPIESVSSDEHTKLRSMKEHFSKIIIGQKQAVEKISRAIQRSRSGLKDPKRPIGVFMFVGPTGVGKTHLTKELANFLFDNDEALIRMDMSEYSEKHNVSRLIGSPPGYVGYGEGGQLTEKVRRNPYSVILFDEIEKAHSDIYNLMLQIMDDGQLTDGVGRKIDFRNCIIIFTSNVGSHEIQQQGNHVGFGTANKVIAQDQNREAQYRKNLEKRFAPEFINRIDDIVTFNTLKSDDILRIVDLEIAKLQSKISSLGYSLKTSNKLKKALTQSGYEAKYGVRSLKRSILNHMEEPISEMIIEGKLKFGDMIEADYKDNSTSLKVS